MDFYPQVNGADQRPECDWVADESDQWGDVPPCLAWDYEQRSYRVVAAGASGAQLGTFHTLRQQEERVRDISAQKEWLEQGWLEQKDRTKESDHALEEYKQAKRALQNAVGNVQDQLSHEQERVLSLEDEVRDMQKVTTEQNATVRNLRNQLDNMRAENADLRSKARDLEALNNNITNKLGNASPGAAE